MSFAKVRMSTKSEDLGNRAASIRQGPHLSIRIVIWILPSDTIWWWLVLYLFWPSKSVPCDHVYPRTFTRTRLTSEPILLQQFSACCTHLPFDENGCGAKVSFAIFFTDCRLFHFQINSDNGSLSMRRFHLSRQSFRPRESHVASYFLNGTAFVSVQFPTTGVIANFQTTDFTLALRESDWL